MNEKKWFASEYGIEEVQTTSSNNTIILSDGTERRVRKGNLFDDSDSAYDSFISKINNSDTAVGKRNKERFRSYAGHLPDEHVKEMFTITSEQNGFFDQKLEQDAKEQTSIKSFFKDKIKSFDVESTGLDTYNRDFNKRARIWQAGLAIEGEKGIETHTNPLKDFLGNKSTPNPMARLINGELKEDLRTSNGRFSEDTYLTGGFNEISRLHGLGRLGSLDGAIGKTLGTVKSRDIVVLQNMNFENNILKSSREQGLLSEGIYNQLLDNMYTTGAEKEAEGFQSILQRPSEVQRHMRQADLIFRTQYLVTNHDGTYNEYMGHLNNAIASYRDVIDDPNRTKAVAVELQDITKYFYAHAADKGYIDKNKSVLGLNVDFLSRTLLNEEEKHTALSDATQTITLMKKMMVMGEELESGNISESTKKTLELLHKNQKVELDRGFLSSINSVIGDFKSKGNTKKYKPFSHTLPELKLNENGRQVTVPAISVGTGGAGIETSLDKALDSVVQRHSYQGDGSIDREGYVESLKEKYKQNKSYSKLHDISSDDLNNFKDGAGKLAFTKKVPPINMKKAALAAAGIGLAYMWLTPEPEKQQQDKYSSASEDYYDDQYLGTEFVNYKERNKHYMM